jgi:uncharacterized protein (TIGR02284 family)
MTDTKTVDVLNKLVITSEDGEKGFAEAADLATDPKLKLLFGECARECHQAAKELQAEITATGAKAPDHGSATGAAHRGWIKLKSTVADTNIALLEEVERGEDHAKAAYTAALKARLPAKLKSLVEKQQAGVLRNHDRIRDLRDSYKAARI